MMFEGFNSKSNDNGQPAFGIQSSHWWAADDTVIWPKLRMTAWRQLYYGSRSYSQPLTAEAQVKSQANRCGICDGHSGTGTGFSPSTLVFPLLPFCQCSILIFHSSTPNTM